MVNGQCGRRCQWGWLWDVILDAPYHNVSTGTQSMCCLVAPQYRKVWFIICWYLMVCNGFKLDGEILMEIPWFVPSARQEISTAMDMLIYYCCAPLVTVGSVYGRSYVVFGNPRLIGSEGTLPLSSLDGMNGFKLDLENNNWYSCSPAQQVISMVMEFLIY